MKIITAFALLLFSLSVRAQHTLKECVGLTDSVPKTGTATISIWQLAKPIPGKIDTIPSLMLCSDTAYTDYITGLDSNIQQHYSPWLYQVFGYALMKHPDTYPYDTSYEIHIAPIPWCIGYLDHKKQPLKYLVWLSKEIKTPKP